MRSERGSALVFGLMVVMGMVVLVSALGTVMNTGRNIDRFNEDRISADYKAEAAIEKALNVIIKRHNGFIEGGMTPEDRIQFETDLESIAGSLTEENDYKVKEAVISTDADPVAYNITGWGRSGEIEKEIETIIAPRTTYGPVELPVIAEGEIIGGEDADESYGGVYNDGGKSPMEFRPAAKENTEVTTLNENGPFAAFKVMAETYIYDGDVEIDVDKGKGKGSADFDEFEEQIALGKTIVVEGNLTIAAKGNRDLKSSAGSPAVVLVEGDLTLNRIRDIEDVVFIAAGDIDYNGQAAHGDLTNCFMYAGGNIDFGRAHGNGVLNPFFNITGQVIAAGDISFYTHHSSYASFVDIPLPTELEDLKSVNIRMVRLTTWDEGSR